MKSQLSISEESFLLGTNVVYSVHSLEIKNESVRQFWLYIDQSVSRETFDYVYNVYG